MSHCRLCFIQNVRILSFSINPTMIVKTKTKTKAKFEDQQVPNNSSMSIGGARDAL